MSELIDNRARKIATLKEIIQHLHKGEAPEAVKSQLREMVRQTNPSEIMAMEQELISGGMPVEEVKSMCDLHSQVTREVLVQLPAASIAPGHPVDTFRCENAAIREVIAKTRTIFNELSTRPDNEECTPQLLQIKQNANELMDIDKHYQRLEHALFSFLETHGLSGPSKCPTLVLLASRWQPEEHKNGSVCKTAADASKPKTFLAGVEIAKPLQQTGGFCFPLRKAARQQATRSSFSVKKENSACIQTDRNHGCGLAHVSTFSRNHAGRDGRTSAHNPRLLAAQQPSCHKQVPAGDIEDQTFGAGQIGRRYFADGNFAEDKPDSMSAVGNCFRMGPFSFGAYRPLTSPDLLEVRFASA